MDQSPENTAGPPATSAAPARFPRRAAAIAALTFLAGPPLGAVPFYLFFFVAFATNEPGTSSLADTLIAIGQLSLFVTLYAYVLGGLQALTAGVLMGFLTWRKGVASYRDTCLVALAVSAAATALVFAVEPTVQPRDYSGNLSLAGLLAALSLLAAVLCRLIAGRIGIYPRL